MAKYKRISISYLLVEKDYIYKTWWIREFLFSCFNTETTRAQMKANVECMKKRYWYYTFFHTDPDTHTHTYTKRNDSPSNFWHRMPGIVRFTINPIHTYGWKYIAWNDMQNHISSTIPTTTATTTASHQHILYCFTSPRITFHSSPSLSSSLSSSSSPSSTALSPYNQTCSSGYL